MSLTKRVGILTGAAALALTGVSFADAPQAADVNTQSRIAELEAQVAQLRASQGDQWLTEQRAGEIRGIVQDALSDADTRASLNGSGMTAGWDKGFFLASADGNFKLKIGGLIQIRYTYNNAEGINSATADSWADLQSAAFGDFGDVDSFNPDLSVTGLGTFNPTGAGSRVDLYENRGLMFALGFTEAERLALRAPFGGTDGPSGTVFPDTSSLAGIQGSLSPGQVGDLDATTALFIHDRIASLTPAQRDAFAAALGGTITVTGVGTVAVPGFTNSLNGTDISFSNYSEYSTFIAGLYAQALRAQSNGDSSRAGFEARRVQINFGGHVVNPQWQYYVMGEFDRTGGAFILQDAFIRHDCGCGWSFKAGQYKAPLLREELVSDMYQQAIERSLFNNMFTAARTQGIAVDYMGDNFHAVAMINDGGRNTATGQTSINIPWEAEDNEGLGVTARLEWLAMGNWDQFQGIPSFQGDPTGVLLGVAAHYDKEEFGTGSLAPGSTFRPRAGAGFNNDEVESFTVTADASIDFGGANLFGAFAYRHLDTQGAFINQLTAGRNAFDQDEFGFVVQGGFFVTSDWELFARYEWADADLPDIQVAGVSLYSFDDLSLLTLGVNKYFSKHQVKWQLDAGYAFDRVEFFAANNGAGWRNETGSDDDGQLVIRTQLQLYF